MAWTIEFDKKAKKEFYKLDKETQKQIDKFLSKLINIKNPRNIGKFLKGNLGLFWRYRVGDFRLICAIEDNVLTILVLRLQHRKDVYKFKISANIIEE